MFTDSWPLDLFWILSFVTLTFAAAAYAVGELLDHRNQNRQEGAAGVPDAPRARGIRS